MSVVGTAYCCLTITDLDRSVAWYRVALDHLAVAVASGSLTHHLSRLDQHHIEHAGATEWADGRLVALTDPDDIEVRLFEPVEIP